MIPHYVQFWTINKREKPRIHKAACFQAIWNKVPDRIRFLAFVAEKTTEGKPVNPEAVDFYLAFARRMLSLPGLPKYTMRKLKDRRFLFCLETKGLTSKQALFPLTWFRYIQEAPDFPDQLFLRKQEGDDDEVLFRKFQEIHYEALAGKIPRCYYPNTNHGLILKDSYGSNSAGQPITIARLAENILKPPTSVFAYFS